MTPESYFTFILKLVKSPDRPISHSTRSSQSFVAKRGGLKQAFKCLTRRLQKHSQVNQKRKKKTQVLYQRKKVLRV